MAGHAPKRKRKKIMRSLKINEISGVDVPAQEPALALIMKRHGDDSQEESEATGVVAKNVVLTSPEAGHSHLLRLDDGQADFNAGETSWQDGHTHPWIKMGGGEIVIGTAKSSLGDPHIHRVAFTSKGYETPEDETAGEIGTTEEEGNSMPGEVKKTEGPTVEDLQAQLAHSQKVGTLTDAEKGHYKGLIALEGDEAAETFLNKSDDERTAEITASTSKAAENEDDPVLYTTADGIELHKSVGPAFISMAKTNDALVKRLDKAEKRSEQAILEKRAEELLPHLTGTVQDRAALLKAVDGIEDEDQRKVAMGALKSQNANMGKGFETLGHGGQPIIVGDSESSLEELVKVHQEANSGMTYEAAYDAVLKTDEGAELYGKSVN